MNDPRKTISDGFTVESPRVFLPWGTPLVVVRDMFRTHVVSFRDAIVDVSCTALGGLECSLLLHGSRGYGQGALRDRFTMVSLWKNGDVRETFLEVQRHLEMTFGPPQETIPGTDEGPAQYKWVLGDVVIGHYADYRSGAQRRASIQKLF